MLATLTLVALTLPAPDIAAILKSVDAKRMRADVEKLSSFHTRNTLSPNLNEAAAWLADQYRAVPGVQAELFKYVAPRGRRIPEDKEVVQVVAWMNSASSNAKSLNDLKGQRIVLVGGHLDSLNLQVDPVTGRAPGANDDASGTVLALECARAMSGVQWNHTVVFVGFTGEEQGLLGSRALAQFAKAQGWKLEAVLSNDTVGSSANKNGQKNDKLVRVFSDEAETHESRELARYVEWSVRQHMKGFGVKLVQRADRFGRGGDHTPFAAEGFSAVRFIEVHEEYTRQHTPDDLPEHMDWTYLANVAKANLAALCTMAYAEEPPTEVRIDRAQSHDGTIVWKGRPGAEYVVYWRDTASATWQGAKQVGTVERATLPKINKDDHFFAVGTVGGVPVPAN